MEISIPPACRRHHRCRRRCCCCCCCCCWCLFLIDHKYIFLFCFFFRPHPSREIKMRSTCPKPNSPVRVIALFNVILISMLDMCPKTYPPARGFALLSPTFVYDAMLCVFKMNVLLSLRNLRTVASSLAGKTVVVAGCVGCLYTSSGHDDIASE